MQYRSSCPWRCTCSCKCTCATYRNTHCLGIRVRKAKLWRIMAKHYNLCASTKFCCWHLTKQLKLMVCNTMTKLLVLSLEMIWVRFLNKIFSLPAQLPMLIYTIYQFHMTALTFSARSINICLWYIIKGICMCLFRNILLDIAKRSVTQAPFTECISARFDLLGSYISGLINLTFVFAKATYLVSARRVSF